MPTGSFVNPLDDPKNARTMYRVVGRMFTHWKLSEDEGRRLLGLSDETYAMMRQNEALPATRELAECVSHLIRIYRYTGDVYAYTGDTALAHEWIRRVNVSEPFLGRSPLEFMCSGGSSAIAAVRVYWERALHAWGAWRNERLEVIDFDRHRWLADETADMLSTLVLHIAKRWKLSDQETALVSGIDSRTLEHAAIGAAKLANSDLVRLRVVIEIDILLWQLWGEEDHVAKWIHSPNTHSLFGGKPAIELFMHGETSALRAARDYLRAALH